MIERISRKQVNDERGKLFVLEDATLPFAIRRVYAISGVATGATRGGHAHRKTDQALFVLSGSLTLNTDDGTHTESIPVAASEDGVRLPPMLWHTMSDFSPDCVALVAASLPYDEADYIRSYDDFKKYAGTV